ncbi:hypothetical protein NOCARDAX2BIS_530043 [Nocardioides sp. AX2bis]|nr:hypothetical protein NOCARDAX2BIS_530043 [Nocardioides sp. AX2bis]
MAVLLHPDAPAGAGRDLRPRVPGGCGPDRSRRLGRRLARRGPRRRRGHPALGHHAGRPGRGRRRGRPAQGLSTTS